LARIGLRIELLEEYPADRSGPTPAQVEQIRRLPGRFTLLATKDRDPGGSPVGQS
jgi:hypothetical protein